MTEYRCLVVTPAGSSDWRKIEAPSREQAAAIVASMGHVPLEIRTGRVGVVERLNQPVRLSSGIGLGELALIMGQLATLIRSGLPIDRSLDLLREQAPKARQRTLLGSILAELRSGQALAAAMEKAGGFPTYVTGVIRSAERSGQLGRALASLAVRLEAATATRRQLITALTYPAAILIATLLALVVVLTVVVPQFAPIFAGNEAKLPTLTRAVLWLAATVDAHGMTVGLGLMALVAMIVMAVRNGSDLLDPVRHLIPGTGLRDQYLAGQFTGLLAVLLGNDVTVVNALGFAARAMGSRRWREEIERVETRVREGVRLSQALGMIRFLPRTAVRLIEVGERTGTMAQTCAHASGIMEQSARARIDRIVSLVNPIAIMTLGGLVAMLVGGVMLGIFSLGEFAG